MTAIQKISDVPSEGSPPDPPPRTAALRLGVLGAAALVLSLAFGLYWRAASRTNHVALSQAPRPVTVLGARGAQFRPRRAYVGALVPWVAASVGPQYVSAYAATVLVRPGERVQRGQVLGTLDCRNYSAESQAVASRSKAIEEHQTALAHELQRTRELMQGGFTSTNEVEQLAARAGSAKAELESMRASATSKSLAVSDCVLRAPFDGEVNERLVDPGAFVRPGNTVVTVIDRSTVRITAAAPESDFEVVAPGAVMRIDVQAVHRTLRASVSRRAPAADPETRTIEFEIDVQNADRALPAGATATLSVEVGQQQAATEVPSPAATLRGEKASVYVVQGDVARRVVARILGEVEGRLYLDPKQLPAGSRVVVEGRALLEDGDRVAAREQEAEPAQAPEQQPSAQEQGR